jgi:putative membrane protein
MHGYGGWHMGGMWFWWILILLVIGAVVWIAISYSRRGGKNPEESPEQTLKRRYAKGEIDREQYDRMLSELRK